MLGTGRGPSPELLEASWENNVFSVLLGARTFPRAVFVGLLKCRVRCAGRDGKEREVVSWKAGIPRAMLVIHHTALGGEAAGRQCNRIPPPEGTDGMSTPCLNGQPCEAYPVRGTRRFRVLCTKKNV